MTLPLPDLLRDVFGGTSGRISLSDADGSCFTSDDFDALSAWCVQAEEPWIDLVTDEGDCAGIYLPGASRAVDPKPSITLTDGMVYLLEERVPNMDQGPNICPVDSLFDALDENETLIVYDPKTLDVETEGSKKTIKLANGRHRQEAQGRWKSNTSTFGQFSDFLRIHAEGAKDGPCFLQGETAGGHRKAAAMISNYILGVDLDSGAPVEDVIASIQKAGLEAVIYTTHSHLKCESKIKRDHFVKWADGEEPNPELVAEYLVKVKGVLPHIVERVAIIDDAYHTEEGVVILVEHNPMPKFRAVFPLEDAFVFAKRGGTQQDAIAEWKERYAGFATTMGFFFDEKCVDPARLFYFPRHKKGDPFGSWRIAGQPLRLDDYDRIRIKRDRNGVKRSISQNAFTDAGIDEEEVGRYMTEKGFNLKPWVAKSGKRFEVEQMLQDICPDMIREPRTGGKPGTHIECPFEAEHSDFGGGGTYIVNAGDNLADGFEGGFTVHCVHNACSGRNRLDFIREMIDQEWVTTSDIQNKDYLLELEDDEEEEEPARPNPTSSTGTSSRKRNAARSATADAEDADDDGDDEEKALRAFNRRYAVIITSGGVKILREPDRDDPNGDVQFLSQNDVALFERNNVVWIGDKKSGKSQKLEVFKLWLEWEKRRTYKNVVFLPGEDTPSHIYNLFRGWSVDPIRGDWSMLKGHIFENICESDEHLFGWFMTWLAHIIQQPTLKPGSTIVITGRKGTGKSTLFDYMNQLLGRHGITVSQRKQIVGQFNGHLATTLLMVCEEAFWAADPQAEGVMKDMITNKSMLIEKKGYDPIQSMNYTRLALISNMDWVVPASLKDERRFGVFRCSEARRGDIDFFDGMRRQMEHEGGLEAMLFDLTNWKPLDGSWGCLYTPPLTNALQQQQIESLTGVQKFMLELVKSGVYETNNDTIEPLELNLDRDTTVYAVDMRAAVEDYLRYGFQSDKAKTSYDDIAKVVKEWFGAKEVMLDIEGQMNKKRSFIFPPLSTTRANLKESKGLDVEIMTVEEVKKLKAR
jgi:energy-coupling factor transporter ATP-binding protein EcfA2